MFERVNTPSSLYRLVLAGEDLLLDPWLIVLSLGLHVSRIGTSLLVAARSTSGSTFERPVTKVLGRHGYFGGQAFQ